MEPAQDVLRQLDPVDAPDHRAVADARLERAPAPRRTRGTRPRRGCRPGRRRAATRTSAASSPASVASGRREVVGPALRVEPAGVVGGHARRAAPAARRSGRTPSHTGGANGVWLKCTHAQVGAPVAQARGDQAQVVVLHEHGRALRRHVGHGVGEDLVHARGRRPTRRASGVEARARGRGPTGRGGRTRAPRCSPRRRRAGRSPRRWRAGGRGSPSASTTPGGGRRRSPSVMAAASQVASRARDQRADARTRARRRPAWRRASRRPRSRR